MDGSLTNAKNARLIISKSYNSVLTTLAAERLAIVTDATKVSKTSAQALLLEVKTAGAMAKLVLLSLKNVALREPQLSTLVKGTITQ